MPLDLECRSGDEPVRAVAGGGLDGLMAAVVDQAPEALRRRILLQAVDWARIETGQVERMLKTLAGNDRAAPRWLAKGLLLGGHTAPEEMIAAAPAAWRLLNRLNQAHGDATAIPLDGDVWSALDGADAEILKALAPVRSRLASYVEGLPAVNLRLTGFSTTSTLAGDLAHAFAGQGLRAVVKASDFGQVAATLLAPDRDADAHILLLDMDGLAQADWRKPASENWERIVASAGMLAETLRAYAERATSPLLVNSIPVPSAPWAGLLDRRHKAGLRRAVDAVNERLYELAERHGQIVVVDGDLALAEVPLARHADPKLWFYGRIAYSAEAAKALAAGFAQAFALARRGPAKALALDFDNTLWGGVYGDDGVERLACGEDYPGNAFLAFQQECLRLRRQGVLLAALSKNNGDAMGVFERHPGMALHPDDFSAAAVNWRPKAENIRQLATELNLGLDSFVFIDDSPHEREAMRRLAPEVVTPELPDDPAQRPAWLRRLVCTWPVRLTQEDETRAEMYAANRRAQEDRVLALDMGAYLGGLEQRLTVESVAAATLGRAAQMHQRTNQFNLTTRRLGEAEIGAIAFGGERGMALLGRVADKFGDHGAVVAATVSIDGAEAEICTFLMSCRVIGREIETAFLGAVLEALRGRGVERVVGRYAPTAKNGIVRDFWGGAGFDRVEDWASGGDGATRWAFSFDGREIPQSKYVSVTVEV